MNIICFQLAHDDKFLSGSSFICKRPDNIIFLV
jgi:hypothetical protein